MTKLIMTVDVNELTKKVKVDINVEKGTNKKEISFAEFVENELRKVISSAIELNNERK